MKTCFAYYRTSTATNAESDTWERQKTTCTAWAKRTGATIAGETREVFTGTEDKRPGLAKLLSEIQPGQTILVAGSDRLSRDLMVQITLLAKFTAPAPPPVKELRVANQGIYLESCWTG